MACGTTVIRGTVAISRVTKMPKRTLMPCAKNTSMNSYQYVLEPYKGMHTRHSCPDCKKQRTFTRYIDKDNGEHLATRVGRCERVDNCGYHYTPKMYCTENNISLPRQLKAKQIKKPTIQKPVSYFHSEDLQETLKEFSENNFITYLAYLFGAIKVEKVIKDYFIGTSSFSNGATVFWQIDLNGRIRTGKVMLYSSETGKRIKTPYNHINWMHKIKKIEPFFLSQCFFGEHLLNGNNKVVAIVESEKTAIIASVFFPDYVWLGCGSKEGLNADKCKVLKGRKVILFPDLNGYDLWSKRAAALSDIADFTVSDLLEKKASEDEKLSGLDLADYLINIQRKEIVKPVLNLSYDEILAAPINIIYASFEDIMITTLETTKGYFDVLFDQKGNLFECDNLTKEEINELSRRLNREIKPMSVVGKACLSLF